jgi:Mrp family chromosome partitioning ATPase
MIHVMIASDAPREGKSMASVAISRALQALGATVHVVDDDSFHARAAKEKFLDEGAKPLVGQVIEVHVNGARG